MCVCVYTFCIILLWNKLNNFHQAVGVMNNNNRNNINTQMMAMKARIIMFQSVMQSSLAYTFNTHTLCTTNVRIQPLVTSENTSR